jgi:hypothetical protein
MPVQTSVAAPLRQKPPTAIDRAGQENRPEPDFSRDDFGGSAGRRRRSREIRDTIARFCTTAPEGELFADTKMMAQHPQRGDRSRPTSARRWLSAALIVWFGGAAIGIATLPKREARSIGTTRPPAHRPVDIESPTTHDLPDVA